MTTPQWNLLWRCLKASSGSDAEAVHIMLTVHHKGMGVAGVFTREIAETKVEQVHQFATSNQHPLRCSMEPER
jgi:ATP-dependent Clp protease adaptor protein ClpS